MELIVVYITNLCSFLSSTYGWRWGAFHEVRSAFLVLLRESIEIIFLAPFQIIQHDSYFKNFRTVVLTYLEMH